MGPGQVLLSCCAVLLSGLFSSEHGRAEPDSAWQDGYEISPVD